MHMKMQRILTSEMLSHKHFKWQFIGIAMKRESEFSKCMQNKYFL